MSIHVRHRWTEFVSAAIACLAIFTGVSATCAELRSPATVAIHPERRIVASPRGGEVVTVNPPPLLWPVISSPDVRYEVRLSQTEDFSHTATIQAKNLRWAMFNPHRKLAAGTWYWQYRTTRRSKLEPKWSRVFRFDVTDAARLSLTPPASQMIASVPHQHPRILVSAAKPALLRQRVKGTDRLATSTRSADRLVDRPIRGVEAARPSKQGKTTFETRNFAKWASKGYAAKLLGEVKTLTLAYLLTGDQRRKDHPIPKPVACDR